MKGIDRPYRRPDPLITDIDPLAPTYCTVETRPGVRCGAWANNTGKCAYHRRKERGNGKRPAEQDRESVL